MASCVAMPHLVHHHSNFFNWLLPAWGQWNCAPQLIIESRLSMRIPLPAANLAKQMLRGHCTVESCSDTRLPRRNTDFYAIGTRKYLKCLGTHHCHLKNTMLVTKGKKLLLLVIQLIVMYCSTVISTVEMPLTGSNNEL